MAILQWFMRCIPGISIVLLFILVELSLGIGRSAYFYLLHEQPPTPLFASVVPQIIFSTYSLALHVLAALFPLRLAHATHTATKAIRAYHLRDVQPLEESQHGTTMVIILPAYKETLDTLRETLDVLASHVDARNTYDVGQWSPAGRILTLADLPRFGGTRPGRLIHCKANDS